MSEKLITKHKRVFFDFHIKEVLEVGMVLTGTEIKSIRQNGVSIDEAFVVVTPEKELLIRGMKIPLYQFGNIHNHQESRPRKLLAHKRQIEELLDRSRKDGLSIVPIKVYFSKGRVKLELGLAKGKKNYDKRQDERKKDALRSIKDPHQ